MNRETGSRIRVLLLAALGLFALTAETFGQEPTEELESSAPDERSARSVEGAGIDSIDGTGIRSSVGSDIDSIDGTGIDSIDGTGIDSIDGTGLNSARLVPTSGTQYVVQAGDTLQSIALAHYGDANKYAVIYEANKATLSSPDSIAAGQALVLPTLH